MSMQKVYIASALLLSEDGKQEDYIFCGVYLSRSNAYKGIGAMMGTAGSLPFIPQVRVAEILDSNDVNPDVFVDTLNAMELKLYEEAVEE